MFLELLKSLQNWVISAVLVVKKLVLDDGEKIEAAPSQDRTPGPPLSDDSKIYGIDCEMVGTGRAGSKSMLARVTVVRPHHSTSTSTSTSTSSTFREEDFEVVYDRIVRPENGKKISDYRTKYSGITKEIIRDGLPGVPVVDFSTARSEVGAMIAGKRIVGHAVFNDFEALRLVHPSNLTRDTALYPPFMDSQGKKDGRRMRQRKLKYLVEEELGGALIQTGSGGHSSAEDASAALALYLKHKIPWESRFTEGESTFTQGVQPKELSNSITLYLDGSNLGGVGLKKAEPASAVSVSYSLVYNATVESGDPRHKAFSSVGWVPSLQSLTNGNVSPKIPEIVVFWDGAGLKHVVKGQKKRREAEVSDSDSETKITRQKNTIRATRRFSPHCAALMLTRRFAPPLITGSAARAGGSPSHHARKRRGRRHYCRNGCLGDQKRQL